MAFGLEADPSGTERTVDVVFVASDGKAKREPSTAEVGLIPGFVSLDGLPTLTLLPQSPAMRHSFTWRGGVAPP